MIIDLETQSEEVQLANEQTAQETGYPNLDHSQVKAALKPLICYLLLQNYVGDENMC